MTDVATPSRRPCLCAMLRHLAAVAFLLVLGIAAIWRWIPPGQIGTRLQTVDSVLVTWILGWGRHAIASDAELFQANIFHPMQDSLATTTHLLFPSAVSWVLSAATDNPVTLFNLVFIASYLANFLAVYALAWSWTRRTIPAILAAVVFGLSPVLMHHLNGQVHILSFWIVALGVLAARSWLGRGGWTRLAALYAVVQVAFATDWYIAVMMSMAVALVSLAYGLRSLARRDWTCLRRIAGAAACGAIAAALALPLLRPYLKIADQQASTPWSTIRMGSGRWYSYLAPHAGPDYATIPGVFAERIQPQIARIVYPQHIGVLPFALSCAMIAVACFVAWKHWRRRELPSLFQRFDDEPRGRIAMALLLFVAGLVLSLGPFVVFRSHVVWLPYAAILEILPQLSFFRAPFRYGLFVALGAGLAMTLLCASIKNRRRGNVLAAALIVLALVELFPFRVTAYHIDFDVDSARPLYDPLASRAEKPVLLELPATSADGMVYSLLHHGPLFNGVSGYDPMGRSRELALLDTLPARQAIWLMNHRGLRDVVVHDVEKRRQLLATGWFDEVADAGRHARLRLNESGLRQQAPPARPIPSGSPAPGWVASDLGGTERDLFFNFDAMALPETSPENGVVLSLRGADPFVVIPVAVPFDGMQYPVMELEIAATGAGCRTVEGTLYFQDENDTIFTELHAQTLIVPADGEYHTVRVRLADDSFAWRIARGIHGLRLDPSNAFPGSVRIKAIRFLPSNV